MISIATCSIIHNNAKKVKDWWIFNFVLLTSSTAKDLGNSLPPFSTEGDLSSVPGIGFDSNLLTWLIEKHILLVFQVQLFKSRAISVIKQGFLWQQQ